VPTLLGFDFGPRKIGVAVGQTVTGSATPLTTLTCRGAHPDWPGIEALVRHWQPSAAVIGLPYKLDDTQADWAPLVHRFARQIQGRFGLTVHLIDERFTSCEARAQLSSRPNPRIGPKPRSGAPPHHAVDALAAALILEAWLSEQPRTP
jgi:putative Holliday junction resolvase